MARQFVHVTSSMTSCGYDVILVTSQSSVQSRCTWKLIGPGSTIRVDSLSIHTLS